MTEPLEDPARNRYSVLPIQEHELWAKYKKAQELFWVEEEINEELSKDPADWKALRPEIRHFLQHILAFFAVSDGVVNEALQGQIHERIQVPEVRVWYAFQEMMENIHNTVYGRLIETYITDADERRGMLDAAATYPTIKRKVDWLKRWMGSGNPLSGLDTSVRETISNVLRCLDPDVIASDPDVVKLKAQLEEARPSLAQQLFVNAIMEGVFFSGSFCAIFWVYHQYGKLPGLSKANEFISRDEGLHTQYGIYLYRNHIKHPLSSTAAAVIMKEAVTIESDFISAALPTGLPGMNAGLMQQYIKFVADQLMISAGYETIYKARNPFGFMNKQSTSVRIGDFFQDVNISEYGHHAAGTAAGDQELNFADYD